MDKFNIAVLVDAKQEYTHQLIQLLYPQIYIGIKSIYDAAKEYCQQSNDNNILKKFQQLLSNVPKWNTDRIDNEFKRIQKNTECDWIEDLITAVFVSHTKVLTAIQLKNNNKKTIQLSVPQGPFFIHKCYTEVARAFWKRPYLLNHQLSNIDLQRNLSDSEQLIKDSIHETIRRMLPVRHILKEYLGNDYKDDELDDDITSQLSLNTKHNLRKLVQQEIEQTLSKKDEIFMDEEKKNDKMEDPIKQIDLPTNKKQTTKNEPLNITKIDDTNQLENEHSNINKIEDTNQLEKELIDVINSNQEQAIIQDNSIENINMDIHKDNTPLSVSNYNNSNLDINNNLSDITETDNINTNIDNNNLVVNDENIPNIQSNIVENKEEDRMSKSTIGLTDIFDIKYNNVSSVPSNIIDIKTDENNYDVFSFFEDAAPYER
jgi:hypothetical protein